MSGLKSFLQRFRGGPDFNQCVELTATLEDTLLTVPLPITNATTEEPPRPINFPYLQSGWFDKNLETNRQHSFVHIYTELWYYLKKGFSLYLTKLDMLSVAIRIKRIPSEKKVNAMDLNALGRYMIQEYDEFYNAPEFGENWLGENTRIAHETRYECERNTNLTEEEILEQIQLVIANRGFLPISPHKIKHFNGRDWVFYFEPHGKGYSKSNSYCLPLNKDFYLSLRFKYQVDISPKFKLWKEHAEAAEQRIMESVKLEKIANQQLLENA